MRLAPPMRKPQEAATASGGLCVAEPERHCFAESDVQPRGRPTGCRSGGTMEGQAGGLTQFRSAPPTRCYPRSRGGVRRLWPALVAHRRNAPRTNIRVVLDPRACVREARFTRRVMSLSRTSSAAPWNRVCPPSPKSFKKRRASRPVLRSKHLRTLTGRLRSSAPASGDRASSVRP